MGRHGAVLFASAKDLQLAGRQTALLTAADLQAYWLAMMADRRVPPRDRLLASRLYAQSIGVLNPRGSGSPTSGRVRWVDADVVEAAGEAGEAGETGEAGGDVAAGVAGVSLPAGEAAGAAGAAGVSAGDASISLAAAGVAGEVVNEVAADVVSDTAGEVVPLGGL